MYFKLCKKISTTYQSFVASVLFAANPVRNDFFSLSLWLVSVKKSKKWFILMKKKRFPLFLNNFIININFSSEFPWLILYVGIKKGKDKQFLELLMLMALIRSHYFKYCIIPTWGRHGLMVMASDSGPGGWGSISRRGKYLNPGFVLK